MSSEPFSTPYVPAGQAPSASAGREEFSRELINPELGTVLDRVLAALPGGLGGIPDLAQRRELQRAIATTVPGPDLPVVKTDRIIPGPDPDASLKVRVYRPAGTGADPLPGLYFIHGGGFSMGDLVTEDGEAARLSHEAQAVVVSVGYRLAPEHPYPTPGEDCYAGLSWMAGEAVDLGIDPRRIGVYGASSGGGLGIATALMARDRGGPAIRFLMSVYPMIDDANDSPSSHEITDLGVWDRAANLEAWAWYLDGKPADGYAAPARAEELAGLPPAFIDVGTVDLFRDEDIRFAQRLMQARVPTELHVYPGFFHLAETLAPEAKISQRIRATRLEALRRHLG